MPTPMQQDLLTLRKALFDCERELAEVKSQRTNFKLKLNEIKPTSMQNTTYMSHMQYAIVNSFDTPMNQWGIFTNPATSIHLFHREDLALRELAYLQKKYAKSELKTARVVAVFVTWEKLES